MEMPKLVKIRRDEGFPDAWDWQREDQSSIMSIYCPILSAVLPKATPGGIAVIFEEVAPSKRERAKIVCYGLESFTDAGELLQRLAELRRIFFDTDRIYARLTNEEGKFFDFFNEHNLKFYDKLSFYRPPMSNDKGDIGYHLGVFRELSRMYHGIIHFPEGSEIPSILTGIPELPEKPITDIDRSQIAAVLYGICAAHIYRTEEPGTQQRKPYDPWDKLDKGGGPMEYLNRSLEKLDKYYKNR